MSTVPYPSLGHGKKDRNIVKLKDGEEFCEALSSGYNMAIIIRNAQQLWPYAEADIM